MGLFTIADKLITVTLCMIAIAGLEKAWHDGQLGRVVIIAGVGFLLQRLCTMPKR
jgi:hypothetical protein